MVGMTGDGFEKIDGEHRVRAKFWPKVQKFAADLPFAEQAIAAYYCAFDAQTPARVRITLIGALAYFILPFDAVADFLPLIGFADDAGVLSAALMAVGTSINESHRIAARAALARMRGGVETV